MRRPAVYLVILSAVVVLVALYAFRRTTTTDKIQNGVQPKQESHSPTQPSSPLIPVSYSFDYPIGNTKRTRRYTQSNDGDGWYNAQDFGANNHLGEDWNSEAGGDADCGLPVYAVSNGTIVFASDAGIGWGNVMIVRHRLPDDTLVETLYGHLQSFAKTTGNVQLGEPIGSIGNANGAYPCHLHFELRLADCPSWGAVGPGYSENRAGWTDPSIFIDAHRDRPVKER